MSLAQLSELNLANNRLTGEIPTWLGSMTELNTLDLSNNLLVGGVPPELGQLTLVNFNVSDNHLSGSIPETFMRGAYINSFLGNPDLCGNPAFKLRLRSCSSKKRDLHHYLPIILVSILVLAMAIILFFCFNTNSRVRDLFVVKPNSSTLTWEVTHFHSGLELDESYILQHLTEENVIGFGGSGKVYKVTLRNGQKVAVKKILKKIKEFEAEVETLGLIRHTNILKLLCCISSADSDFKLLVFEYIQNGSLFERLHGSESMAVMEWPVRQKIAVCVARGLFYLHNDCSPPILHRDVKSSNILLDSEFEAKIADFGVAKRISSSHHQLESVGDGLTISGFTGSHGYIAPEYCMGMKVSQKSDVYSFGVVLLELVSGKKATGEMEYGESLDIVGWIRSKLMFREPDEWGVVLHQEEEQGILDSRILQAEDGNGRCREKMLGMLGLGLLCTSRLPNRRPSTRQVVEMLQSI
jgi:hypothetical protein